MKELAALAVPLPTAPEGRSFEVAQRLVQLKRNVTKDSLEMGRLLIEARNGNYQIPFGFTRFGDWVESESGLDIGERTAYYLMQIVERAQQLGIPDEKLHPVKLSKLKEIFALRSAEPDVIKELVEKAATATLDEIKNDVRMVKIAGGAEPYFYITLKIPLSVKQRYEEAHERVRREAGNTMDQNGNAAEIPDWRCLEYIYNDYLAQPVEQVCEPVDAEFSDTSEFYVDSI